jgi:hypothetical protein
VRGREVRIPAPAVEIGADGGVSSPGWRRG